MNRSIAIVGAGISGLTAARELKRKGYEITVFERGRGPGGRAARRRADRWEFDHGAQYFTVRDPRFRLQVEEWVAAGAAARWDPRIAVAVEGSLEVRSSSTVRYVGTPGMNALARNLAGETPIQTRSTVTAVRRVKGEDASRWTVTATTDGNETEKGPFDAVIFAAPPPQWSHLLAEPPSFADAFRSIAFLPTWAVMLGFDEPLSIPADGVFIHDEVLSWAARNDSKPGRDTPESWVLHANPAWARGREEMPPEEILPLMVAAFRRIAGSEIPDPVHAAVHRWRLSRSEPAMGVDAFWDGNLRIGACGDWCVGSRIEGAYLSGLAVATYLADW